MVDAFLWAMLDELYEAIFSGFCRIVFSQLLLELHAATLFCGEAPKMFCGI